MPSEVMIQTICKTDCKAFFNNKANAEVKNINRAVNL